MSISSALKKKRDAEERLRDLSTGEINVEDSNVITDPGDVSSGGSGLPDEDNSEPSPGEEPADELSIGRYAKSFNDTVWEVNHNLGRDPVISIWAYNNEVVGFGTQPFGTSSYGGHEGYYSLELANQNAAIRRVNVDKLIITWPQQTNGKVVCIG